ncbi:MAG: hypothetical protein ACD_63C00213G0004 [uncultured bacterium]|nr:MAG: hypothetical protein ACD_63C00213G0004 [uncultured bacterium]
MPKQVLGRGLEALIPTKNMEDRATDHAVVIKGISEIQVDRVIPNPHQPRRHFDKEKLKELSDSIKKHGVLQPLVVTKFGDEYELIAGERRLKAAKLAGLASVPAVVKEATEQDKLELSIVENVQRDNLNSIEEARAYAKLIDEFNLTQEGVSMRVGKSREAVANTLRLLNLPEQIQEAIINKKISHGHAKAILSLRKEKDQILLFKKIISGGINVRETEEKAREKKRTSFKTDPYLKDVEEQLRETLGTKVSVRKKGKGAKVAIECYSKEELSEIVEKIVS